MCGPSDTGPEHDGGRVTPDPAAFANNLSAPMSASRKLRLIVRNNALKIARLQSCCGHPGEPGC